MDELMQLKQIVKAAKRMVFFGGAGVSTESGIPDFRSQDGLYSQKYAYPPEEILSHGFFFSHTEEFYRFYRDKMLYPDAKPNAAHMRLAEWEREGRLRAVITQNIDGLHQKAGSRNVLELHGSVYRNRCTLCGREYPFQDILAGKGVPRCPCGGVVKPDVVLYGEALNDSVVERSIAHIAQADVLIIGGTSLNVYPASGLIDFFGGEHLVVVNRGTPARSVQGALFVDGKIGEVFSSLE